MAGLSGCENFDTMKMTYTHLPPKELRERLTTYRNELLNYLHDEKIEAFTTSLRREQVVIAYKSPPDNLLRYCVPMTNSAKLRLLKEINRIDMLLEGRLTGQVSNMLGAVRLLQPPG